MERRRRFGGLQGRGVLVVTLVVLCACLIGCGSPSRLVQDEQPGRIEGVLDKADASGAWASDHYGPWVSLQMRRVP